MRVGAATHTGRVRSTNEDAYCVMRDPAGAYLLLAVADGMGGHEGGEIASALALSTLAREVARGMNSVRADPAVVLTTGMERANQAVYRTSIQRLGMGGTMLGLGMGTTLTCALIVGGRGYIAHVGDSRAYRWRGGSLHLITQDHSLVAEMVRDGELDQDQADQDPRRHVLTRAVGTQANLVADLTGIDVQPGDRLLLCSDGLSGVVGEQVLGRVLSSGATCDEIATGLVDEALEAGGPDNITAVVLFVNGAPGSNQAGGRHD